MSKQLNFSSLGSGVAVDMNQMQSGSVIRFGSDSGGVGLSFGGIQVSPFSAFRGIQISSVSVEDTASWVPILEITATPTVVTSEGKLEPQVVSSQFEIGSTSAAVLTSAGLSSKSQRRNRNRRMRIRLEKEKLRATEIIKHRDMKIEVEDGQDAMAGRSRLPRHHQELRNFHEGLQPPPRRHAPMPLHPIEEEIVIRRDEIRRLRADNHLLVEENVAFRREIAAAKEELHALGQVIPKIRADKEAQARELIEKGLKLEKELRGLEPLRAEHFQLKSESQKLDGLRKELSGDVQNMSKELKHLQADNQQISSLRLEIDGLHQEMVRARTAYEYEKKANADQLEQRQVLDKNLATMAREVEKLRAEHMSMENRARGSGPGAYGDGYGSEKGLYDSGSWLSYEHRGFPRH